MKGIKDIIAYPKILTMAILKNVKSISLKDARSDARYLNVNVLGNKKLINNKAVRFIIWNIPAKITCPYATEHCKGKCYAVKAEKAYPTVLPARQKNFNDSRRDDFVSRMVYTLGIEISNNEKHGAKTVVRVHESGDFYNKKYADDWRAIAEHFTGRDVVFMAYTKSVKYFVGETIPENMIVRFSIWDDTRAEDIETAATMNLPTYSADTADVVDSMVEKGLAVKCDCADCANCGKCWDVTAKRIYCVIH